MGLFDFATDLFSDATDNLFGAFSGGSNMGGSSYSGGVLPVSFGGYNVPQMPTYQESPPVYQTMAAAPMVARAAAAGIARWSVSYPSLWQALQVLRGRGVPMTIEKLYSALKRFGPATVTGIVGAAAVNDLINYKATHKGRRMNVANTKALRKSIRRLKGFENLSHRVTAQLASTCKPRHRRHKAKC